MGERVHKSGDGEKKTIQPQREEEQRGKKNPTEALTRLSANVAQPSNVLTLQRTIGNKAVTNMIQRHPESDAEIRRIDDNQKGHRSLIMKAKEMLTDNHVRLLKLEEGGGPTE